MKINNMKSIALLAMVSSALLTTAAHAGAVKTPGTAVAGDLLLGVRATGGTGTSLDVIVDLGAASGFTSSQNITTGTLGTALTSAFGSDWATRADVQVGVIGTTGPVGADAKTLFASNARSSASNPSTPWITASSTQQGGASSSILAALGAFKSSASATAVTQNTTDVNSWASFQAADGSFGFFSPTIEGAPAQTLDLFKLTPNASGVPATRLGTIKLNADATVSFTAQADVDSAVAASSIDFTAPVVTAARGATSVTITLVRSGGTVPVTATLTTSNGTATAPTVSAAAGAISFDANVNTASVTIPVTPNTGLTGKAFNVALTGVVGTNASVGSLNPTAKVILPGIETGTPLLTLAAPTATASVIGTTVAGSLSLVGTADDDVGIQVVMVKVNSGVFRDVGTLAPLSPANPLFPHKVTFGTTATPAVLTNALGIINGINTVTIRAVDSSGNTADIVRYVRYTAKGIVTATAFNDAAPATLLTGLVAGVLTTAYTVDAPITATAKLYDAAGNVFSYWTVGSSAAHIPGVVLNTLMSPDLLTTPTIKAHYVNSPLTTGLGGVTSGTYAGLVTSSNGYADTNATNGYITATVSATGTTAGSLTASIKLNGNGAVHAVAGGKVQADGTVLFGTAPAQLSYLRFSDGVVATLKFDFANKVLNANVYDATNLSTATACLQSAATAKNYTFHLATLSSGQLTAAGLADVTKFPQGDSIGNLVVTAAGAVSGNWALADGKAGTVSGFVTGTGLIPLYFTPYTVTSGTAGSFSGVAVINAANVGDELSGSSFKWFRGTTASGPYQDGWTASGAATLTLHGAVYNSALSPVLIGGKSTGTFNDATFFTSGVGLVGGSQPVKVKTPGLATAAFAPVLVGSITTTFTAATGILSGTRGTSPTLTYKSVVIQGVTNGVFGFFTTGTTLATDKAGLFTIVPSP